MGPMFRILDIERIWSNRRVRSGPPLSVALEVHDPQIAGNEGAWTFRFADGRIEVVRGTTAVPDVQLRTRIDTLSRLFIGAVSSSTAVGAGAMEVTRGTGRLAEMDELLRLPRPWMFDRF